MKNSFQMLKVNLLQQPLNQRARRKEYFDRCEKIRSTTMKQLPNCCYDCKYLSQEKCIFGWAYCTKYNVKISNMVCCKECNEK